MQEGSYFTYFTPSSVTRAVSPLVGIWCTFLTFFKFSHVPNVSNVSYFSQTFIRPCYKRAAGGRRQKCQKARRPCSGEKQNCTERRIALTHAPSQLRGDLIDISRRSAMALCPNRFPGQNCPSDHPR